MVPSGVTVDRAGVGAPRGRGGTEPGAQDVLPGPAQEVGVQVERA